jgi:hypothetical protein
VSQFQSAHDRDALFDMIEIQRVSCTPFPTLIKSNAQFARPMSHLVVCLAEYPRDGLRWITRLGKTNQFRDHFVGYA